MASSDTSRQRPFRRLEVVPTGGSLSHGHSVRAMGANDGAREPGLGWGYGRPGSQTWDTEAVTIDFTPSVLPRHELDRSCQVDHRLGQSAMTLGLSIPTRLSVSPLWQSAIVAASHCGYIKGIVDFGPVELVEVIEGADPPAGDRAALGEAAMSLGEAGRARSSSIFAPVRSPGVGAQRASRA